VANPSQNRDSGSRAALATTLALIEQARSGDPEARARALDALEAHARTQAQQNDLGPLTAGEFKRMVEVVEEGIAVLDPPRWTVRFASERMRRLGGRSAVRGPTTLDALLRIANAREFVQALEEAHALGAPARWESADPRPDGHTHWLEADLLPLHDGDASGSPVLVVLRDVTERKRVEARLVRQTELLEQRNAELRDFAWSASHDLRAPLRKIRAFIERLTESAHARLDETENDFLTRMHKSADALERRIEAMLAFSKISGRELVFGPADLSAIVRETLSGLELMVEQTRAVVQIAPLPVVHSDAVLLGIIFQNLLSNALKYRRRDLELVVSVRSAPLEGGKWRIDVTDNGLGFDAADSQRIFAPFERLHASLGEDGTGVGLALARRLAERLGGTLTATAQKNEGATFTLVLPADLTRS